MPRQKALGDYECIATWSENAADLTCRLLDIVRRAKVLDGREREDDIEACVLELQ
jgi:hypothetical protein